MDIERQIRGHIMLISTCLWLISGMSAAFTDQKYKIYCINHKVGIEMMSREELLEAGFEEVCELTKDEYENLDEAGEAAKAFGGIGAPCDCSH
jgi:hypothetical protein